MKKVILIIVISLFLLTGCGTEKKEEEIVSYSYINSNNAKFCNEYAITSIFPNENAVADIITVYKHKNQNDYVKLFETEEFNFNGTLLIADENIYFVYGTGLKIIAYPLDKDGTENFNSFEIASEVGKANASANVYYIKEVYGIRDDYIYFSYVAWDNRWSNPIIINYGKISLDLKNFEEIKENDIPTIYYKGC